MVMMISPPGIVTWPIAAAISVVPMRAALGLLALHSACSWKCGGYWLPDYAWRAAAWALVRRRPYRRKPRFWPLNSPTL